MSARGMKKKWRLSLGGSGSEGMEVVGIVRAARQRPAPDAHSRNLSWRLNQGRG